MQLWKMSGVMNFNLCGSVWVADGTEPCRPTVGMSARESPVAYDNLHFFAVHTDRIA